MIRAWTLGRGAFLVAAAAVILLCPVIFSVFFTSQVALTSLWFGLVAVSLTFLSGYGGMVSLAQAALFGVAGLVSAKLAVTMGWNIWLAALAGIVVATAVGLVFGALASGSRGIYFLVITLAFAEITYSYFAAVNTFGAHEGINGDLPPAVLGNPVLHPARMYYFTLGVCILVYLALRYIARTPFGIALQGVRDDPVRMSALGYNVRLHRMLGFTLAAPIAGMAGVIAAWSYTRMSADSVSLSVSIFVLAAAVIGGLFRLEGAWVGAFVYTMLSTYLSSWTDRYATWIGVIFLVIVLVSPGGLVGAAGAVGARLRRRPRRSADSESAVPVKTPASGVA